jgi:PAS domain S-box-containing protein
MISQRRHELTGWSCVGSHPARLLGERAAFVAYLSGAASPSSDLAAAERTFTELADTVAERTAGPVFAAFDWDQDGMGRLCISSLARRGCRRSIATAAVPVRLDEARDETAVTDGRRAERLEAFALMELGCWLEQKAGRLAVLTAAAVRKVQSPAAREVRAADLFYPIATLGRALIIGAPKLFERDIRWGRETLVARGFDLPALRATWTALQTVLLERAPPDLTRFIKPLLAVCFDEGDAGERASLVENPEAAEFFRSLSNSWGPRDAVARLNAAGLTPERLFLECFTPAQHESGRLWQYCRMSVEEEHRRTAVVRDLIAEVGAGAPVVSPAKGSLLAASAPQELHDVGLQMVAELARLDGWNVSFLGGNLSEDHLFDAVLHYRPDVVAFSASLTPAVCALVPLIARLKTDSRTAQIPIVAGGAPFAEFQELARIIGADETATDAATAVQLFARLHEMRAAVRVSPGGEQHTSADGSSLADISTVSRVLDLNEQQQALLELEESELRYHVLAEALPQMIVLSDGAHRPIYVNRRFEEYTGIRSADVAQTWREAVHPDDLPALERAHATGDPYELELRIKRASDGAYRWHAIRSLNIRRDSARTGFLSTAMDIDDRKRAEETLRFIEKAGSRLAQSLDLQTILETLLDLIVPEFGDWASIKLRDEDGARESIAARHKDPSKTPLARAILAAPYLKESGTSFGLGSAYRAGVPQLLSQVSYDDLSAAVKEHYVPVFEQLGYGSQIWLPVRAGDQVIAGIGIFAGRDRLRYTPADLPALEELARRASFAIGNARRYEREHRVAHLFQEAALPRKLPAVAGFRFDAYYQPGRQEASIGGDWFDVFVLPGGRVVVSVGDVAGSGLPAAVLMSSMRQVIRGAAHVFDDPAMVLDLADRTLRSEHEDGFVTAFVGAIDSPGGSITYASAGHVPALLRTPGGSITALYATGLPLGCHDLAEASSASKTASLAPGSSLLLYTDGLVEWSHDLATGESLLQQRFAEGRYQGAAKPAMALVESVLPATGALDDVAALIVTTDP